MITDNQILKISEQLQKDCHKTVDSITSKAKASYQDATNVWLFTKLAEIETRLKKLEKGN